MASRPTSRTPSKILERRVSHFGTALFNPVSSGEQLLAAVSRSRPIHGFPFLGAFHNLRDDGEWMEEPSHVGWAKAIEDARFAESGHSLKKIKITRHLSGEEWRKWSERRRNAGGTGWGRGTAGSYGLLFA